MSVLLLAVVVPADAFVAALTEAPGSDDDADAGWAAVAVVIMAERRAALLLLLPAPVTRAPAVMEIRDPVKGGGSANGSLRGCGERSGYNPPTVHGDVHTGGGREYGGPIGGAWALGCRDPPPGDGGPREEELDHPVACPPSPDDVPVGEASRGSRVHTPIDGSDIPGAAWVTIMMDPLGPATANEVLVHRLQACISRVEDTLQDARAARPLTPRHLLLLRLRPIPLRSLVLCLRVFFSRVIVR